MHPRIVRSLLNSRAELVERLVWPIDADERITEPVPQRRHIWEDLLEHAQGRDRLAEPSGLDVELTVGEREARCPVLTWQRLELLERVVQVPAGRMHGAQGQTDRRVGRVIRFGLVEKAAGFVRPVLTSEHVTQSDEGHRVLGILSERRAVG